MSKGVLGNDPFLRGAAPRAPAPSHPAAPPPALEAAPTKPAPPRRTASAKTAKPSKAAKTAKAKTPKPQNAAPPAHTRPHREDADSSSVSVAHPASPDLLAVLENDDTVAHPASPVLVADVARAGITQHQSSPDLVAVRPIAASLLAPGRPTLPSQAAGVLGAARELLAQVLSSPPVGRTLTALGGLFHALRTSAGMGGSLELDEYGRDAELVRRLEPVADFLFERYWRVQLEGAEQLPRGASLLVANHSGALPFDGPVLQKAVLRERRDLREPRWLAEDQTFHAPFLGTLVNRLGAVRACPENALRLLDEGRPVIVFPEGAQGMGKLFGERYRLKRFGRGGFVKIALRTGLPIVPVAIVGAEEAMPLFWKLPGRALGLPYLPLAPPLPLPTRWFIRVGAPIEMPRRAEDELVVVQRLSERTRESIQLMLTDLLALRPSVF